MRTVWCRLCAHTQSSTRRGSLGRASRECVSPCSSLERPAVEQKGNNVEDFKDFCLKRWSIQGQNPALTVLFVPSLPDGAVWGALHGVAFFAMFIIGTPRSVNKMSLKWEEQFFVSSSKIHGPICEIRCLSLSLTPPPPLARPLFLSIF